MVSASPVNPLLSHPVISYPRIFNVPHDEDKTYRGAIVKLLDEERLTIADHAYRLVYNYREGFDPQRLGERFDHILNKYDYIVGDWGYDQLRLRGFYRDHTRSANRDQTISTLQDYVLEFCNFGCAFFVVARDYEAEPKKQSAPKSDSRRHKNHRNRRRRKPKSTRAKQQAAAPRRSQNQARRKQGAESSGQRNHSFKIRPRKS